MIEACDFLLYEHLEEIGRGLFAREIIFTVILTKCFVCMLR